VERIWRKEGFIGLYGMVCMCGREQMGGEAS